MAAYYPPPSQPAAPRRRNLVPFLVAIIGVLVVAVAVLITVLVTRDNDGSGGDGPTKEPIFGTKVLSHVAVERYIAERLLATNVVCNDGQDLPLTADGATYTCTADGGKKFTVTIKDKNNGSYMVS